VHQGKRHIEEKQLLRFLRAIRTCSTALEQLGANPNRLGENV
jgi:hypothetical protein